MLNTDRRVENMAPIARSPAVQHAVADKLDAAITGKVDFAGLLHDALPPRADPLAPAPSRHARARRSPTWPPIAA
jgi:hypothetical protein